MSLGRAASSLVNNGLRGSLQRGPLSMSMRCYIAKLYSKDHEWVAVDGDVATVGITNYAQSTLGDLVYLELPEIGKNLVESEEMGTVESVKAASDIYSPISGEVLEVNAEAVAKPGLVNQSPDNEGWLVKMKLEKPQELERLLDEVAYASLCEKAEE